MDEQKIAEILKRLEENEKRNKAYRSRIIPKRSILFLLGFTADQDTIKLDKSLLIKKVPFSFRKSFFERMKPNDEFFSRKKLFEYEYIAEYNYQEAANASIPNGAYQKQDQLVSAFRMFKEQAIESNFMQNYVYSEATKEFLSMGVSSQNKKMQSDDEMYHLTKTEIKEFKKFWKIFNATELNKNKALSIALRRYNYTFNRIEQEDRLIDLMISFEAMFLTEKNELSYRLALRVANFLSDKFDPESIYKFVKEMYNLRSKIVHGGEIKFQNLSELDSHLKMESNFLFLRHLMRLSIKKYIYKYSDKSISQFLATIDKSIIRGLA